MKPFKKTFLYFVYNELAFFSGGIIGGFLGLATHLILGNHVDRTLLYGITGALATCAALFLLMLRDAYEERQFPLKAACLAILPGFALRWLVVFLRNGDPGFLLCGSASMFTDGETVTELTVTLICFDLLIHLPAMLLGGYLGYRKRQRETEAMTQEKT